LHGFALLLTLGNAPASARLAAAAIEAGTAQVDELRHPERAAAWLRRRVARAARKVGRGGANGGDRLAAVAGFGVDEAVLAGLAALRFWERVGLIASSVERLDERDVATIVGTGGRGLDRLLHRARRRYVAAHVAVSVDQWESGPVTDRIHAVASRAMQ
ncbi:MAG: hypothetical protein ABIZ57_05395, partial [Candidatus Limnocylindria bacterium]